MALINERAAMTMAFAVEVAKYHPLVEVLVVHQTRSANVELAFLEAKDQTCWAPGVCSQVFYKVS